VEQYQKWMTEFPKVAAIPYALGHAYAGKESPKAKSYLLEALEIDPKFDKAYFDLWIDTERWGEFKKSQQYIKKAAELQPDNPDYSFYYAMTYDDSDPEKYKELSLDVAKRFPNSERGAQALYWLAVRNNNMPDKIKYFEMLKSKYAPSKFGWSSSGMSNYFDLLLKQSPAKAVSLAQEMIKNGGEERDQKEWKKNLATAVELNNANELLAQNKNAEALAAFEKIKLSRWSRANNMLLLQKAKAMSGLGKTNDAYEQLKVSYAKLPEPEIGDALNKYGKKLGKNEKQIQKDVWYIRDTSAKMATPFTLKQYFKPGSLSLSDFKGKVVLLTYWFPGCGPCRGEFPHFQNVVDKFKGKDLAYVGINIVSDQNEYVIPFLKSSGYTFLPLEDVEGRDKGNLDNHGAAPVNFLIDKEGRIVYKNIRTDGSNEDVLENMINSLLKRG
jgi:thiol-disulfide isomerase/thioredoxin